MDKVLCIIRKILVPNTPEEAVRQKVLHFMTASLGYPESGFVIEQSLHTMPHLQSLPKNRFPKRRADILFFARDIHPVHSLYPLILIECKAVKLTPTTLNQVLSYNYYLQSFIVAVVNATEAKSGIRGKGGEYRFHEGLPSYTDSRQLVQ